MNISLRKDEQDERNSIAARGHSRLLNFKGVGENITLMIFIQDILLKSIKLFAE